jgi:DNA gyrase/topoisomerase IV subunit A
MSGDRIQIVAKPGVESSRLSQYLYAYTNLESTYPARNLCLQGTKPTELPSSEITTLWKEWRLNRLRVQFEHERDLKETRHEIVLGLLKAIDKIDLVIKVIRAANSPKEALVELVSNRSLKFTSDQSRAIMEMKLRSLTNLDSKELLTEKSELEARLETLKDLISNEKTRKSYMLKEIKAIATRHGETRRSAIIDPPETLHVEKGSSRVAAPAKPKFLQVDTKKGVITQAKGPRGALVLEKNDRLVAITEDGTLRKLPPNFKGPISTEYSPVVLAKKETEVATRKYLLVFTLDGALKAMTLDGEILCKSTSKGKCILPDGAKLVHFGEGTYVVPWASTRKKPLTLDLTTKLGKPGGKGIKIANLDETHL